MSTPITIPAAEMSGLLGKAIIDSLSDQSKETVLAAALEYLLKAPETQDRYSSKKEYGPSPLEIAFRDAVNEVARDVARELAQGLRPQITVEVSAMLAKITSLQYDGELRQQLMDTLLTFADAKLKEKRGY